MGFVDGPFGRRIPREEKNEYYERKHGVWRRVEREQEGG